MNREGRGRGHEQGGEGRKDMNREERGGGHE